MTLPLLPRLDDELDSRNPLVLTVDGVLDDAECRALIERIEAAKPEFAPVTTMSGFVNRPDIRNNDRVIFDDPALSTLLFDRVKAWLPERLETNWLLHSANERLRCYRYRPGQFFASHFDGAFHRGPDERSVLTFMVYLNEVAGGGHTVFDDLELSVEPRAGRALLFNHHLRHQGARVDAGIKYAVRSDVMYRRT